MHKSHTRIIVVEVEVDDTHGLDSPGLLTVVAHDLLSALPGVRVKKIRNSPPPSERDEALREALREDAEMEAMNRAEDLEEDELYAHIRLAG
jgi:hypothetical protein